MGLEELLRNDIAKYERKMTQWTKWSLLRILASAGYDADEFRALPTDFLRLKLLTRVSTRETQHYLNKTDAYVLNVDAVKDADAERWLWEYKAKVSSENLLQAGDTLGEV